MVGSSSPECFQTVVSRLLMTSVRQLVDHLTSHVSRSIVRMATCYPDFPLPDCAFIESAARRDENSSRFLHPPTCRDKLFDDWFVQRESADEEEGAADNRGELDL